MATRKKKIEKPVNMPAGGWPQINQGTHLTVKTFEDGRTELVWDDAALLNEVKAAILSVNKQETENGNSKTGKQSRRQTNKSK
jgi:malate synthase